MDNYWDDEYDTSDTYDAQRFHDNKKARRRNRIKSRRANKQKFWCWTCDAELRGEYGTCSKCGTRHTKKKYK